MALIFLNTVDESRIFIVMGSQNLTVFAVSMRFELPIASQETTLRLESLCSGIPISIILTIIIYASDFS